MLLTQDNYIKSRLVEMGWRFGQSYSGGHVAGQMVMHAIANRVRCGWASWLEVIDTIPKYMAEKDLPPLAHPSVWDAAFVKLLHVVDGVYDGSMPDITKGALYWGRLSKIERPWFKQLIAAENEETGMRQHARVADMNDLSFWD